MSSVVSIVRWATQKVVQVDVFRQFYSPVHTAFGALDTDRQAARAADLIALLRTHNRGGHTALVVPGEYLEIVITR
jgi:hypothetical protein